MLITFHIPGLLRDLTGNRSRVDLNVQAGTVGEALDALGELYPGVRDRVLQEDGAVRTHVNLFVGKESIRYTGGLKTIVWDGCEVSILPAVSGGIS